MANLSNIRDTSATISASFDYAVYTTELLDAAYSVADAIDTITSYYPDNSVFPATNAWAQWWDGTELRATLSSWGGGTANVTGIELDTADGAWLSGTGKTSVKYDVYGDITAVSTITLKELSLGNDGAALLLNGAITLNPDTGTLAAKVTSVTFGWNADDPATAAIEWEYVTLKGSVSFSGLVLDGSANASGKISSIEWGTLVDTGSLTWIKDGSVSGLALNAADAVATLNGGDFAALSGLLYAGNDVLGGTALDDVLEARGGNDKVSAGDGDDYVDGGSGNDQLDGGAGDDYLIGGAGNDKITDTAGNNFVDDLEGNAAITTGAGNDDILTGSGNDKIAAGDGENDVYSGAGNDNIVCGSGDDEIAGGDGNDKIAAGNGFNDVDGGAGNDVIVCGSGSDIVGGGTGADKLSGGTGADAFLFDNLAVGGVDTINDFNAAEDLIALDTTIFTALAGGINDGNFRAAKTALDADDFLVFDTQGGKLYYDADGNGAGAAVQIAIVKGSVTNLSAANFIDADSLFA